MPAHLLTTLRVEKLWGRRALWPGFDDVPDGGEPVGEIWFDAGPDVEADLLVKYLFTSERLSIQVHPDDAAAQAAGHARGKDEAWVILAAEPGSTIALGTRTLTSREALAAGALDGSIVDMLDWRPVAAGDVIYSPAGTVHAIGAGITMIEVQQNLDLTYRLYDYGRPRELHLTAGIAVSEPVPFVAPPVMRAPEPGVAWRIGGAKFTIEQLSLGAAQTLAVPQGRQAWVVPVSGQGTIDDAAFAPGECWIAEGCVALDGVAEVVVAIPH